MFSSFRALRLPFCVFRRQRSVVTELTAALAATGNTKHDFSFFGGLKGKWVGLFMLPPLHGKNQSAACIGARFCRSRGAHDAGKNCICV